MRTIVKGKNIELPDRVRTYAERKLRRLERLLDDRTDAIVELSNEQHKSAADAHIAEVTLVVNGQTLRSHATGPTYQAAIDAVVDRAERQAVDHKERPRDRARSGEAARRLEATEPGAAESEPGPRIVKVKRFAIEPMFEEDAITQMEELGHAFFLFVNAENERLNLLYRRRDGNYGIIEPVVGGGYTPGRGNDRSTGRHAAR
jgi:putative sigma-54 modulation protein